MRILLVSSPRTASKWVHRNLLNYIDNKSCNITLNNKIDKMITNWFETYSKNDTKLVGNIKQVDQRFILESNEDFDLNTEMNSRINLLLNYQDDIIVKIHPIGDYALDAIDKLKANYDYYYTLDRRDFIEHCMSIIVSNEVGIHAPGKDLDFEIDNKLINPGMINFARVQFVYKLVHSLRAYLQSQNPNKHLYCEDIVGLNNSYDFCDYLNLPRKEFPIESSYGVEYGDNKPKMFKNYEDVKKFLTILPRILR